MCDFFNTFLNLSLFTFSFQNRASYLVTMTSPTFPNSWAWTTSRFRFNPTFSKYCTTSNNSHNFKVVLPSVPQPWTFDCYNGRSVFSLFIESELLHQYLQQLWPRAPFWWANGIVGSRYYGCQQTFSFHSTDIGILEFTFLRFWCINKIWENKSSIHFYACKNFQVIIQGFPILHWDDALSSNRSCCIRSDISNVFVSIFRSYSNLSNFFLIVIGLNCCSSSATPASASSIIPVLVAPEMRLCCASQCPPRQQSMSEFQLPCCHPSFFTCVSSNILSEFSSDVFMFIL